MMVQEALTASHMYSQSMPVRRSAGVTLEKKSFFAPLIAGPIVLLYDYDIERGCGMVKS